MYFPPPNFGAVEEGLYRSGFPTELNFSFIESLGLKSVVILSPDGVDARFLSFLEDCLLTQVIFVRSSNSHDSFRALSPIAEETVVEALHVISNRANLPALVMCHTGKHLTGVVIGCLRKLQRWSFMSIFEEYRRFACGGLTQQYGQVHQQHEQFMELFDCDLISINGEAAPEFMKRYR
jgi:tyrosine-protein phosphatase OCA1